MNKIGGAVHRVQLLVGKRLFHAEPEALPGYDVGSGQSQNEGHNQCTHRVNQTVFQRRATNSSVKCSPVI